eukprot:UN04749
MHGSGSCVTLGGGEETLLFLHKCLVCNATESGILQQKGMLVVYGSEVCSDSNDGVCVKSGTCLVRRCQIFSNGGAGLRLESDSSNNANVCVVNNNFRVNRILGIVKTEGPDR